MQKSSSNFPWYKELWVWFFLGILGLGIIAGSTIFTIGMSNPPEMVVGDYARFARGLVDTNQRASRARALGLEGRLIIDARNIQIELQHAGMEPLPRTLLILFQHPATSEKDLTVRLEKTSENSYQGLASEPIHPRSRAIVYDLAQTWWLSTPENTQLDLGTLFLFPHRL